TSGGSAGGDRQLSLSPAANRSGTATITVTVSDGSATATQAFSVTVNPVNDAPALDAIGDQSVVKGGSAGLAVTLSDIDNPVETLTMSARAANEQLLPASGISIGGQGGARTLT